MNQKIFIFHFLTFSVISGQTFGQLSFLNDCKRMEDLQVSEVEFPERGHYSDHGYDFSGCILASEDDVIEVYLIRSGAFHGRVHFYKDGKPEKEIFYKNGILNGRSAWYYPDGQIRMEENYEMGHREGTFKEWFENGQLKRISEYKNNQLQMEIAFDEKGVEKYRRGPEY